MRVSLSLGLGMFLVAVGFLGRGFFLTHDKMFMIEGLFSTPQVLCKNQ